MLRIEFEPSRLQYHVFDIYYNNGQITAYRDADNNTYQYAPGSEIPAKFILTIEEYEDFKKHFLSEYEVPVEAKQAAIDELRSALGYERRRVDSILDKAINHAFEV